MHTHGCCHSFNFQQLVATCSPQINQFVFCFQVSKAACILTTQHLMRTLRSKEAAASVNIKTWPTIIDTGTMTQERPFDCRHFDLPLKEKTWCYY